MSMKKKMFALLASLSIALVAVAMIPASVSAETGTCGVDEGATTIFEGMATDAKDITIYNDEIAASFAVGSNNYWNMTKGSILDIGIRGAGGTDGDMGVDLVNDVELLTDLWTSTGTYNGTDLRTDVDVSYKVAEDKTSVTVTSKYRYWVADPNKDGTNEDALPLNITQVYTLEDGNNYISMKTTVENPNESVDYANMYTGYSISTLAANMYGPFGYYPDKKATGIAVGDAVDEYFGKYVATYSNNYAVSLQMDETDAYKGSSGYKDVYKNQDLKAGETYTFTGEVLVEDENSTAEVLDRWYDRDGIADSDVATVSGKITDENGKPVEGVNVMVEKNGKYMCTTKSGSMNGATVGEVTTTEQPFVWDVTDENGEYSFNLPKTENSFDADGDYNYKLKLEGAGYSSQTTDTFALSDDATKDFVIKKGATIKIKGKDADDNSIPIRVEVSGVTYENKCAGLSTYFSDSTSGDNTVEFNLTTAKDVTFTVSYGKDFESKAKSFTTDVTEAGINKTVTIKEIVNPEEDGWYSMDNHQHSNFGDGATTPKELFNAQIAAKLDFNLVADHDTRINNWEIYQYAKSLGRSFLSNEEVSPGWGHWGVLNVDYDEGVSDSIIDATTATPAEIIKAGHDNDAVVIVHHPYSDYGFLNNQASVNGGKDEGWDDFDLLEIQSTVSSDGKTLDSLKSLTKENYDNIDLNDLNQTVSATGVKQMDAKALITAFAFWNEGIPKYLSAGSDQHQATNTALYPGIIREYAQLGTKATKSKYLKALTSGKAYVSTGPLFFTYEGQSFGDTITSDTSKLKIDVQAVNGLSEVTLYSNGVAVGTKELKNTTDRQTVTFKVDADDAKWYSYVVSDENGGYAISNPIWVEESSADTEEEDGLTISAKTATLGYGETLVLTANEDVTWTSSDEAVATVDENGTVTAVGLGTAKVKAKTAEGDTVSCKVTVEKATQNLKVSTKTKTVKYSKVKKAAQKTSAVSVSGVKTTKTYSKVSGSAKLTMGKDGKIKVKKGTKKGTYSIKIKVKAAGSDFYNTASKTVTVKVKVK